MVEGESKSFPKELLYNVVMPLSLVGGLLFLVKGIAAGHIAPSIFT